VASLDLTPQIFDIKAYGGDTLTIQVSFPAGFVAGRVWRAQVRPTATSAKIDAEFQIILGANADAPVTLRLTSAVTRALVTEGAATLLRTPTRRTGPSLLAVGDPLATYKGVYDCQVAPSGGGDPTNTVVRGNLELTLDVTRTTP